MSFAELKGIYEWQLSKGINLLCPHLEGYSIRGLRKRDYPPAMYKQQPWWKEYGSFIEALSRESMILREGAEKADVLVLHPQTTAWSLFDNGRNEGLSALEENFRTALEILDKKHITYHLGDETIIERHARVENGKIIIGTQRYATVVNPGCKILLDSTKRLLTEFMAQGGKITIAQQLPENRVTDCELISYTKREYNGYTVHYFTNSSDGETDARIFTAGKELDIYTGELKAFCGRHTFSPWGSLMLIDGGDTETAALPSPETLIEFNSPLRVSEDTLNCMTLDRCDYYFDGVLQEKNGYVLNICERANALGHEVHISQKYYVRVDYVPKVMYLVCETPEKFTISVNGESVRAADEGYFVDKSFRKISISNLIIPGMNTIELGCKFEQKPEFYKNIKKAMRFESEKNKLTYDCEIEAVYLLGNFSVRTQGVWTASANTGMRYEGDFIIDKPCHSILPAHIEQQGYPFFCGTLKAEGEINVTGENPVLVFDRKGFNVIAVEINGKEKILLTENKLALNPLIGDLRGVLRIGIRLTNNLRNLLGPHHLKLGECFAVGPHSFYKEPCVWNSNPAPYWSDSYTFVETGI